MKKTKLRLTLNDGGQIEGELIKEEGSAFFLKTEKGREKVFKANIAYKEEVD